MLTLDRLSKRYGDSPLFDNLNLALGSGEYVAITGESGSGKSTFLNLIAGLDRPDEGRVLFGDIDLATLDDDAASLWRRRSLGFVFQSFHVLPYLTVAQNVALPLKLNGWSEPEIRLRVSEMLDAVDLGGKGERFPRQLSGGETQRVAIARALVHRPPVVLADEPTGNLDPRIAEGVLALLASEIRRNGAAGILVTHSLTAAHTADRVLELTRDGLKPRAAG
jgi:putative ABC transport system ATP-binding protein